MNDLCSNCGLGRFDHVHSRLRGYVCPGGRGKFKSAFHTSRSGQVHDYHCLSLTHDGPCNCPLILRKPLERTLNSDGDA